MADEVPDQPAGRGWLKGTFEIVETLVLTLVIYLLIHTFVAQPFEVQQTSMTPTIVDGDYVLIDKLSPHWQAYGRGDVVVFQPPERYETGGIPFVKRVIGLPGDTVHLTDGRVVLMAAGGEPVTLSEPYVSHGADGAVVPTLPTDGTGTDTWVVPDGSYFVMGDNRTNSVDARSFGPIAAESLVGRAWFRYFPLDRITVLSPSGTVRALTSE